MCLNSFYQIKKLPLELTPKTWFWHVLDFCFFCPCSYSSRGVLMVFFYLSHSIQPLTRKKTIANILEIFFFSFSENVDRVFLPTLHPGPRKNKCLGSKRKVIFNRLICQFLTSLRSRIPRSALNLNFRVKNLNFFGKTNQRIPLFPLP